MSAPIHGLIRESQRFLYVWGCCFRSECPLKELVAQQPAPQNRDSPVVPIRMTWNRIGGPPKVRRLCRAAYLFCCWRRSANWCNICAVSGALTSFAMSNSQQFKINDEITKLGTLVGHLNKIDQNQ